MQELTGRNQRRPRAVLTRALSWLVAGIGVLVPMASVGAEVPVHRWGLGLESGVMKLQDGAWDYSAADQFGRLPTNWNNAVRALTVTGGTTKISGVTEAGRAPICTGKVGS